MISDSGLVPEQVVEEGSGCSTPKSTIVSFPAVASAAAAAAPFPNGDLLEHQPSIINDDTSVVLSRNPFKRIKQHGHSRKEEKNEEMPDPREPNIKFKDHLYLLSKFGWFNLILILFGSIGAIGAGLISLFIQFIVGDLLNILTSSSSTPNSSIIREGVNTVGWKLTIVAVSALISNFLLHFFFNWANERVGQQLKELYFNSLTAQEIAFFDIKKVGALTSVLSDDVAKIQDAYTMKLSIIIQNTAKTIGGLIMSFTSSWQMSLVIISTSPLIFLTIIILDVIIRKFSTKTNQANDIGYSISTEIISSIKTVRSMSGEIKEQLRYKSQLKIVKFYGFFKAFFIGLAFMCVGFILWGTIALGFWYGGNLVIDATITLGDYFKVFGLMLMSVMGLIQITANFPDFTKARLSETHLLKVIKREPEIPFKGGKTIDNLIGNISIRNVDFIYPSRPNTIVLKNFSLEIKAGQSVALVGPSGSGKSTIVGLLERFYNPNNGIIEIDGIDITEIDPMWLHRNLGIVTQEPVLFGATIKENIAYAVGLENVTEEQIVNAAKVANCHSFIMDLPEQYETILGEKGVSMSGGQKQRIAIARALIQNPKLLLLDEATSALDTESESLVQEALDNLMRGRTTICIAHRLSTIKDADMICVLVKGKLMEKGKHDELLQNEKSVYRKLAEKQLSFSSDNPEKVDAEVIMDLIDVLK